MSCCWLAQLEPFLPSSHTAASIPSDAIGSAKNIRPRVKDVSPHPPKHTYPLTVGISLQNHVLELVSANRRLEKDQPPVCEKVGTVSNAAVLAGSLPVQTYLVPLPEQSMFSYGFYQINPQESSSPD